MTEQTNWLTDAEQFTWRQWTHFGPELTAALQRDLQRHGDLSLPDFQVLAQLTESRTGRLRPSELATSLQWEQSRLSHQVRRMETRGLITREPCADDARGSDLTATRAGRAAIEAAAPGHVEAVRRMFVDRLSAEEVEQLGSILARLRTSLDPIG